MRRSIGGLIEITIRQTVASGFDRRPIREPSCDLFKPLRDGVFDLILGKLNKGSIRVETFGPNMII